MHIYGPAHLHGPQSIGSPHTSRISPPTTRPDAAPVSDELDISAAAQSVEQARQLPDIRQERVDAIRTQIASGTYETQDKLETAVSRLLDEIG